MENANVALPSGSSLSFIPNRLDLTLHACFLNLLSPNTNVWGPSVPRPVTASQSKACPTPAPGPAYIPAWAEPWVPACLTGEILACELLGVSLTFFSEA